MRRWILVFLVWICCQQVRLLRRTSCWQLIQKKPCTRLCMKPYWLERLAWQNGICVTHCKSVGPVTQGLAVQALVQVLDHLRSIVVTIAFKMLETKSCTTSKELKEDTCDRRQGFLLEPPCRYCNQINVCIWTVIFDLDDAPLWLVQLLFEAPKIVYISFPSKHNYIILFLNKKQRGHFPIQCRLW